MSNDFSRLANDLGDVPGNLQKFARKAVEVSARNVKDAWADRLKGSTYVPAGARTIGYDVKASDGQLDAEIGPQLGRRQATIVGILETGTPHTGARGFGLAALHDNQGDFVHGLERAIDDALDEAGL